MIRSSLLVLALTACTVEPTAFEADTESTHEARYDESSAEAFGILALLADAATTQSVLDDDAALDVRAARSIIAYRNGGDGTYGTADDKVFGSLAEVDAQYYVGNSALDKLAAYAALTGHTPAGGDIVGSWEGVSFTFDQVTATLALANDASEGELDYEIGLNSRAVTGIIDARPISSMSELAAAYYVGRSAMTDLKAYVEANAEPELGQAWDMCDTAADCAEGLVCMGEYAYGSGIYCVDDTMYDNFTWDEVTPIPDNDVLVTSMNVQDLGTVPVDVILTLEVDHPRKSDLVVTISNFNGYSQVLWDHDDNPPVEMIVRAFPSDDMVNGEYTVTIEDTVAGEAGELMGWNLYIVSNWD